MSSCLKYLLGILIAFTTYGSLVFAQEEGKPVSLKEGKTTMGIIGDVELYFTPITDVIIEFLNSLLINVMGEELPCTVFSLTPFKYSCTKDPDVPITTTTTTTEASS